MNEMDAVWLIPALVATAAILFAYAIGKEVGKDHERITEAFWDGFDVGVEASIERVRSSLDEPTIYEQMLAERSSQTWDGP